MKITSGATVITCDPSDISLCVRDGSPKTMSCDGYVVFRTYHDVFGVNDPDLAMIENYLDSKDRNERIQWRCSCGHTNSITHVKCEKCNKETDFS